MSYVHLLLAVVCQCLIYISGLFTMYCGTNWQNVDWSSMSHKRTDIQCHTWGLESNVTHEDWSQMSHMRTGVQCHTWGLESNVTHEDWSPMSMAPCSSSCRGIQGSYWPLTVVIFGFAWVCSNLFFNVFVILENEGLFSFFLVFKI